MSSWELVSEQAGGTVSSLLVRDADVLALTTAAVHRSVDAGATWSTLTAGRLAAPLNALMTHSASLYVGGQTGVARSRDLGRSWSPVLTGQPVVCLGVTPDGQHRTLLAGTQWDGMLRSEDAGDTWASANPGLLDLTVLCLAAASTGVAFAGTPTGIYRSSNAGRSWREVDLPCGPASVECLAVSDDAVLAGTDAAGTFVSRDGGRTWSAVAGVPESAATAVCNGPGGSVLAIGAPGGVHVSLDRGETWRFDPIGMVLSLACLDDSLLAGVADEGIMRLDGFTGQWRRSTSGLHGRLIVDLACSADAATLLTADVETGVRRSRDAGRSWERPDAGPTSASHLAASARALYAATTAGLHASQDDGRTWSVEQSGAPAIAISAASAGVALVAFDNQKLILFESQHWQCLEWDPTRGHIVSVALSDTGVQFVGTMGERSIVWRSTGAGQGWSAWFVIDHTESLCIALSPNFAVDDQVLVGAGTRVYRPLRRTRERSGSDSRPLWLHTQLPDGVTRIAFGAASSTVYAATASGVYRSNNAGADFTSWNEGLEPNLPVLALQCAAEATYALGFGGALWRRSER
jgi:photosystem II stability/assembly factor-like uncharacterized protein